jgi:hypothetical protein
MSAHIATPNFAVDWNAALDNMTSSNVGATVTGSRSDLSVEGIKRFWLSISRSSPLSLNPIKFQSLCLPANIARC